MPRQFEVCTVKHRTLDTEDRCPRRHPDGIREQQRKAQAGKGRNKAPTQADIEWADRWRPRIFVAAGVVGVLVLALAVYGAVSNGSQDSPSPAKADSASSAESSTALTPAEKRKQQKAKAEKAKKECLNDAQDGATIHECGGHQTYVTCDHAANGRYEATGDYEGTTIVCDGSNFVAVAWNSDDDHAFKRVRYAGRWIGRAVSPGHGTRQPKPVPKPAPKPYVPPNLTPDYSDDSSGGDLSGYTGPRCYAPGGKTWSPC